MRFLIKFFSNIKLLTNRRKKLINNKRNVWLDKLYKGKGKQKFKYFKERSVYFVKYQSKEVV